MPAARLPGRLPADAVFPAGRPGHLVRWLDLPGGERVRAVVCEPASRADPSRADPSRADPSRADPSRADPSGADPSGAGPAVHAVVCVHGWGCSAYTYHPVLRRIADTGVLAVAPDLRGHGWSSKPLDVAAYTPAALAGWLLQALDALGVERAVVVGHSLGGHVALEAAIEAPARVAGLVLVGSLGFAEVARLRALRLVTPGLLSPVLPYLATRAAVRVGLATSYGSGRGPTERDIDEYWAPTADPNLARAARLVAHASTWGPGTPERLARVTCPTHVMLGDEDNLIGVQAVRPLAAALPRGTFEVLPGVGHVVIDEVPDRVLAAVAAVTAAAGPAADRA